MKSRLPFGLFDGVVREADSCNNAIGSKADSSYGGQSICGRVQIRRRDFNNDQALLRRGMLHC